MMSADLMVALAAPARAGMNRGRLLIGLGICPPPPHARG